MKIYLANNISAPTKLQEAINMEWFDVAEIKLKRMGFEVLNPIMFEPANWPWERYLAQDLLYMQKEKCTHIYMGTNWRESQGARLEFEWAKLLGLEIIYE